MTAEPTSISPGNRRLKLLVEAALRNELHLLCAGIHCTEQKLQEFENRYGLPSVEFIHRCEQAKLEETLEYAEWIGEYHLLERLREKVDTLQAICSAN